MTQFSDFVQEYRIKHGISYKAAQKQCKQEYQEYKKQLKLNQEPEPIEQPEPVVEQPEPVIEEPEPVVEQQEPVMPDVVDHPEEEEVQMTPKPQKKKRISKKKN